MELSGARRFFLIIGLPVILILSTAFVFFFSADLLNDDWGYVTGFLFYWVVWCYLIPLFLLGKRGFIDLFKQETSPLFSKRNWYLIVLLLATIAGSLIMYFIPEIGETRVVILLLAIPVAIVAGTGEEVLWRGLYIRSFPGRIIWAYLYPSILFTLQHIWSQFVEYSADSWLFVVSTLPLGLVYGLVAYLTNSIRWNALTHVIISFFALGAPVTTSIYNLAFQG